MFRFDMRLIHVVIELSSFIHLRTFNGTSSTRKLKPPYGCSLVKVCLSNTFGNS